MKDDQGHRRANVVKYDHETQIRSRLEQWLDSVGLHGRRGIGVVRGESAQPSAYTEDGSRPRPYNELATPDDIDREEARLVERAKAAGFFWDDDVVSSVIAVAESKSGGSEHNVYIVGKSPNKLAIRRTIKDSYGFAHRSPAQYLQRLADYNQVFPEHPVVVIGVSLNKRGNGVVWTAQPFVKGKEFKTDAALQRALEKRG